MPLPKRIFVYLYERHGGHRNLVACTSEFEVAHATKRIIGIYELKKKQRIQPIMPLRVFVCETESKSGEKYLNAYTSEFEAASTQKHITSIYELKEEQTIQLQPVWLSK